MSVIAITTAEAMVLVAVIAALPASIAAVAAIRSRREIKATHAEVMTNDGKTSGETLHGVAQTVEIIQAQQHTNAREVIDLHTRLGRIEEKVDRIDGRVDRVDTKLDRHLVEVGEGTGEMADRVRERMGKEQGQ